MSVSNAVEKPWVTFDMDRTLAKSPYWRLHFLPWLQVEAARRGDDFNLLRQRFHAESEARWRRGDWVQSFDWPDIAATIGLPPVPDALPPSTEAVRALVLPGVERMLWELRALDVHLGVVTNGFFACQMPYLKALGWNFLFDAVITPDLVGCAKPDPAALASLQPGLVHIGDRLSHDILVAQRSRRKSILLGPEGPETDRIDPLSPARITPDFHVPDARHVPPIIRALLAVRT